MLMFNVPSPVTVDVQVTGIETIDGRLHKYVRCFGQRVNDERKRVIEFHLTTTDAGAIIESAYREKAFPIVEVPSNRYTLVLSAGDVKCVHMEESKA